MGLAGKMQRRRKAFSRLLLHYGQRTLLVAACVLFVTCFIGQQSVRSQFTAASSIALVGGSGGNGESAAGGDAGTGPNKAAGAPVTQTKPVEVSEPKPVAPAVEPKPVEVSEPKPVAPVAEPKPVEVSQPKQVEVSEPKPVAEPKPAGQSAPVVLPKPVGPEHPHAHKTAAAIRGTRNNAPLDAPKPPQTLAQYLHFTSNTRLNFMHFHKTGGVSYKIALYGFFGDRKKADGTPVRVRDACYEQKWKGSLRWRCDWEPVWQMAPEERAKIDVFFGHQYRAHGVDNFLKGRDVRTFAIIRHPFARKVSFFYHFFVRERKRKESSVPFDELKQFLLTEKIPADAEAGYDIGPNYMAGRLLSTGTSDFVGDGRRRYYEVPASKQEQVINESQDIIRKYVFIGLQTETEASVCMLKKTVEAFNKVHGIVNKDTDTIASSIPRDNAGSYKMTAEMVWNKLTPDEQKAFNEEEKVDLAIYDEGLKMFKQQVKQFQCDHLVKKTHLS